MPTGVQNGKYWTVEEIKVLWSEYKQKSENHLVEEPSAGKVVSINRPQVLTLGRFCHDYLKMTEESLLNYGKAKGYEDYFSTIRKIKDEVFQSKKDALVNARGSTTGLIFDLKVNYGMIERQIVDTNLNIKADFGTDTIHTTPEAEGNTPSPQ